MALNAWPSSAISSFPFTATLLDRSPRPGFRAAVVRPPTDPRTRRESSSTRATPTTQAPSPATVSASLAPAPAPGVSAVSDHISGGVQRHDLPLNLITDPVNKVLNSVPAAAGTVKIGQRHSDPVRAHPVLLGLEMGPFVVSRKSGVKGDRSGGQGQDGGETQYRAHLKTEFPYCRAALAITGRDFVRSGPPSVRTQKDGLHAETAGTLHSMP